MTEIEVQNKINFRNIIILFLIGLVGVINGASDFSLYQKTFSKVLFPDPVVYQQVVIMNQSMMNTLTVQNSFSFGGLAVFVILAVIILGLVAGTCGTLGAMGD